MTINELMTGKKPGEIKITGFYVHVRGRENYYFTPYFMEGPMWHGLYDDGVPGRLNGEDYGWRLYEEKPKNAVDQILGRINEMINAHVEFTEKCTMSAGSYNALTTLRSWINFNIVAREK